MLAPLRPAARPIRKRMLLPFHSTLCPYKEVRKGFTRDKIR